MKDFHGIIFAYKSYPELRELVQNRTAASLPVCGEYRLIDFALSSFRNAGITDVGVIMQRDYQSLLDHIGSGKAWDMSKHNGGLKILPPFGLPQYHKGDYAGTIEALNAVSNYIKEIPQKYVILALGGLCANIDYDAVCHQHLTSGAGITAICGNYHPDLVHNRYVIGEDGNVERILLDRIDDTEGVPSLEGYVMSKELLLELMDTCKAKSLYRFHHDALRMYLENGGIIRPYMHTSYARFIQTVEGYYEANMNMLDPVNRAAIFTEDRPVRSTPIEGISTYYGVDAKSKNCLVADNCVIEGSIENCIIFPDVHIGANTVLKNCIVLSHSRIGANVALEHVITDKNVTITDCVSLVGNSKLPIVVPKGATI